MLLNEIFDLETQLSKPGSAKSVLDDLKAIGFHNAKAKTFDMNVTLPRQAHPSKSINYDIIDSETYMPPAQKAPFNTKLIPDWIQKLNADEIHAYQKAHKVDDDTKRNMEKMLMNLKATATTPQVFKRTDVMKGLEGLGWKVHKMDLDGMTMTKAIMKKGDQMFEVQMDTRPIIRKPYIKIKAVTSSRDLDEKEIENLIKKAQQ